MKETIDDRGMPDVLRTIFSDQIVKQMVTGLLKMLAKALEDIADDLNNNITS